MGTMFGKLGTYAPHMKGPMSIEESVKMVLDVVDNATIERNGGQTTSHLGNKTWI